jgi:hypothetical protein
VSIQTFVVEPGARLDRITAYFHDVGPREGRLILCCWTHVYQAYWSAIGDRTLRQFVTTIDAGYLTDNLARGVRMTQRETEYMRRVVDRFHAELKADAAKAKP